jgi:hypothetical protein
MAAVWLAIGGGMALYLLLAFGWTFQFGLGDLWMNEERWWRFLLLIPIMLPFHYAEELAIGVPSPRFRHPRVPECEQIGCKMHESLGERWMSASARLLRWFGFRLLLWIPLVVALFVLRSEHILTAIMALVFLAVSLGQRLGADVIRRRTGSFVAGAIFSAILAAWFIAAVFPLT